jgi:hypothetical protein
MGLPTISSAVLKPNVGDVVNQNQGFVLEITVDNSTGGVEAYDTVLQVTSVSPGITVGVGLNVPIKLPTIADGGTHAIPVVFETDETITDGNKIIKLKVEGYFGGPEWFVYHSGGGFLKDEALHEVFPKWSDTHSETVKVYKE